MNKLGVQCTSGPIHVGPFGKCSLWDDYTSGHSFNLSETCLRYATVHKFEVGVVPTGVFWTTTGHLSFFLDIFWIFLGFFWIFSRLFWNFFWTLSTLSWIFSGLFLDFFWTFSGLFLDFSRLFLNIFKKLQKLLVYVREAAWYYPACVAQTQESCIIYTMFCFKYTIRAQTPRTPVLK